MIPAPISEATWQEQVIQLAHAHGYKSMHVRRSIGKGRRWTTATSCDGWPDLVLWNPVKQRTMFVELKSEAGVLTVEQRQVLQSLSIAGNEVHVWRPADLDAANAALARPIGAS